MIGLAAAVLFGVVATSSIPPPEGMQAIPSGSYLPFAGERRTSEDRPKEPTGELVRVASFFLDVRPVTNREYLAFVEQEGNWRRSRIASVFADSAYLRHWAADLALGSRAPERSPVTNVSWFAAKAYCAWRGKRLPTMDEWEYAAHDGGRMDEDLRNRQLRWLSMPNPRILPEVGTTAPNGFGVADLHGLVWEWVLDFNRLLASGESRTDGAPDAELFCGGATLVGRDAGDYPAFVRFAFRSSLEGKYAVGNLGFRCALDANG